MACCLFCVPRRRDIDLATILRATCQPALRVKRTMLRPRNGEHQWRLEELAEFMSKHHRRHDKDMSGLRFHPDAWTPFPWYDASPLALQRRELRLLETRSIGRGTFGVVYAGAVSLAAAADGSVRYAPAAIKFAVHGSDHMDEAAAALAFNDAVTAGMTPNLNRIIDAFAVSPVVTGAQLPPASWERFWAEFTEFVVEREDDFRQSYGRTFALRRDEDGQLLPGRQCLPPNLTLCVSCFELAPNFLERECNQDDIAAAASPGQPSPRALRRRAMLGYAWQVLHAVCALHSMGVLHGDIHGNNIVNHGDGALRASTCRLRTPQSDDDMRAYFGCVARGERPNDALQPNSGSRFYKLPIDYRQDVPADYARVVRLDVSIPQVALIDYGAASRAEAGRHLRVEQVRKLFGDISILDKHVISDQRPVYQQQASSIGREIASGLPGMVLLESPTTMLYARAPELLNPKVDTAKQCVVYSELSDAYSAAVSVCEHILGFHLFSERVHITESRYASTNSVGIVCSRSINDASGRTYSSLGSATQFEMLFRVEEQSETEKALGRQRLRSSSAMDALGDSRSDKWASIQTTYYNDLYAIVRPLIGDDAQSAKERAVRKTWFGSSDNEIYAHCVSLVNRVYAIGSLPLGWTTGRLMTDAIKQLPIFRGRFRGWLTSVLNTALVGRYGLPHNYAKDLTDLLHAAMQWDPAERPSLTDMLRCPAFSELYVRLDDPAYSKLNLRQIWSCQTPTPLECRRNWVDGSMCYPSASELSRPAPSHQKGERVSYSEAAYEAVRQTSHLRALMRERYCLPTVNLSTDFDRLPLHPDTAYLLHYFTCDLGLLDPYDGTQLLPCNVVPGDMTALSRYKWHTSKRLYGRFRTRTNLRQFVSRLARFAEAGRWHARISTWLLARDLPPPPPHSSTRLFGKVGVEESPTLSSCSGSQTRKRRHSDALDDDHVPRAKHLKTAALVC